MFVTGKWLACQSMDNQIVIFNALNRFKFMRKKVFKGHMVAGYACGVDFSPEMRCVVLFMPPGSIKSISLELIYP